jgi:hypothetical protein
MSRANKRDTEIRAALETIGAELAVIKHTVPLTQVRIQQARDRTGLDALLSPAQVEMDEVVKCVSEIGHQVRVALERLGQC